MEISPEQIGLALFAAAAVASAFIRRWIVPGPELYERLAEKDEIIAAITDDREAMRSAWIAAVNVHRLANDVLEVAEEGRV